MKYRYPDQRLFVATQEGKDAIERHGVIKDFNDYDQVLIAAIKNHWEDFAIYALEQGTGSASKAAYTTIISGYPKIIGEITTRTAPEDQIELYQSVLPVPHLLGINKC